MPAFKNQLGQKYSTVDVQISAKYCAGQYPPEPQPVDVPGAEVGEVAELRGEHLPRLALVVAAHRRSYYTSFADNGQGEMIKFYL